MKYIFKKARELSKSKPKGGKRKGQVGLQNRRIEDDIKDVRRIRAKTIDDLEFHKWDEVEGALGGVSDRQLMEVRRAKGLGDRRGTNLDRRKSNQLKREVERNRN